MAQPQFDPMGWKTKPYAIDAVDLAKKASLNTKKELATKAVPSSSIQTTHSYDFDKLADTLIQQQQVGTLDRSSAIENLRTFATDNPDVASKMYTAPRFDYGSIRDNLIKQGKDKWPTLRATTQEESKSMSARMQIDASLADYATRLTGNKADQNVVSRALGSVPYKDMYQYEKEAKIVINDLIRRNETFDIGGEMLRNNDEYLKTVKPIYELSPAQKLDRWLEPGRQQFRAGMQETEIAMSWLPDDWKEPKIRGGTGGMSYIAGQAMGLVIDNVALGGLFKAVGLTQKLAGIGRVTGAFTQGLTGSARMAGIASFATTGILDSGLQMSLQGQLVNPDTWAKDGGTFSERYDRFFTDFAMGSVFALGGAGSRYMARVKDMSRGLTVWERLGVSGMMSGFGYTVTKLQGGSEEEAMQSAILFGMLEISGALHDTISRRDAKMLDGKVENREDLRKITDRATQELKDLVGGDQKAYKDMMLRYQDIRDKALNAEDGLIPGFFDTPSGKKLFEIYTTPKDKLTKQQIQESYSLMGKAIEEVKSGKGGKEKKEEEIDIGAIVYDKNNIGLGKRLRVWEKIRYEYTDEFGNKTEVEWEFVWMSEHKSNMKEINLKSWRWIKLDGAKEWDNTFIQIRKENGEIVEQRIKESKIQSKEKDYTENETSMFQKKMIDTKVNPNSFFRSADFKEFYTKGTEISPEKMGGDIVVDQNGAIISGFAKAKEAMDAKKKMVDVKQVERNETPELKTQTQDKIATPEEKLDTTNLQEFEGYSDVTTRTLDKIEGKKVVSRQFIENSLREQGMKEQERAIIEEVLKEYEGKRTIPAQEFAEKVHERLMPLAIKEIDPKWEEYQLAEDGYAPGSEEGYVEIIHEAPMETNQVYGASGHFGDELKYFGHSRIQLRNIDGKSYAVVNEVQSDFMQGEKYKNYFLKEEMQLEKNIEYAKGNIRRREEQIIDLRESIKNREKDIEILRSTGGEEYIGEFNEANKRESRWIKEVEDLIESYKRDLAELNDRIVQARERSKNIKEGKEYKMIDSYRTTWSDRMIREVIKYSKDKGLDGVMFPDGKTVAFVERWNWADGVSESAEVGDTVEVHGENVMVLENGGGRAKVVREDAIIQDLRHEELLDDMIQDEKNRLKEDWEYEREKYADKFAEKAQESERYEEFVKEVKESDLDEVEMMEKFLEFDENEYQIARDKVIEEVVEERAGEWRIPEDMAEYMRQKYGDNVEVYYPLALGGGREPHILKLDEGAYTDYVDAKGDHADRDKSLEELQADWSDSQKGTSFFYEKIVPKVLEKQRKDMYKWTDPDTGLEFYRVDFNENDKPGQPIYAYQKMEQARKKAEITPEMAEAEIRKYFSPEEINVNFVEYITTPEGFKAFGRYRNGAIDLVKNPDSSTPTHEALHAYFDMFTAPGRKAELLEQVKTEQGMKDNVQAEEWLADNFVEYVRSKDRTTFTEKVAGFFKDVWEGLRAMFGKEEKIKSFYDDIIKRKRDYLAERFSVITRYSSENTKDPIEEISKNVLRDGENRIGFDTYTEKTARERFDIPKLQQIGKGSDRTVFDLGGGYVLKVSQSERGISQNAQADFFLADQGIIPGIKEIGRNYVVMERVKTYQEATPEERKMLSKFAEEVGGAGQSYRVNKSNQNEERLLEALEKWGWDALSNYDIRAIGWGDIRKANLGVKDGKPILLDEGTINLSDFSEKPTGVKESLKDPEFRSIYYDSKRAKSDFGDKDGYTRFQSHEIEVQKMKLRIEEIEKSIRNDIDKDPFGSPEDFKDRYAEIEKIEQDILDSVDKEAYMKTQKETVKEWLKDYAETMVNETDFAMWQGSDKQTKQMVTQEVLLPSMRQDPALRRIIEYAGVRGIGEGELITKIATSDTTHLDYLADYILRSEDRVYGLIQREIDYPWVKKGSKQEEVGRKKSKAEDALAILRGQKEKADLQAKIEKMTPKEKMSQEKKREELDKMASYAKARDRMSDQATKEDPDLLRIYQEWYDLATKKMNMGVGERLVETLKGGKEKVGELFAPIWKAGRTLAMPISSRLKQIAPEAYHVFKRMEFQVGKKVASDLSVLDDFIKGMKKMQENDMRELSLALLNADTNHAKKVLARYNIADQFDKVRGVLDQIHKEATEVGIDVAYLDQYFPRMIKNLDGLMGKLEWRDDWTQFYQALKEEAKKKGTTVEELTKEDKAKVLNSMLRGMGDKITLTAPGNLTKARMLDKVTADLGEYYYSPIDSLLRYIQSTRENIEARKFFGKGEKIEDSIGAYTATLVEGRKINQAQAKEMTKILRTYFGNQKAQGDLLGTMRNITYMLTIMNPKSAITNLEDISVALGEGGVTNAVKALINKDGNGIKLKDIGLHELQGELTDRSNSAKMLEIWFKYSGFQFLDTRMKETFTEAYYQRIKSEANDPKKVEDLRYEMIKYFPKEEVDQIVKDLQKGWEPTELVYEALYRKLSAIQPISMGEVPELYLQHSGFKLFYALKTFQLKRWEYYRSEALRDITNTKDPKKLASAGKRILALATYMYIVGFTTDTIKNFIFGRPIDPATMSEDQMWKILGVSKYQIYGSRDKGAIETLATSYLTPALFTMTTDIGSMYTVKDKDGNDQVLWWKGDKYIPYIWPMVTWWFGSSGARLDQKEKEKKEKEARDRKKSLRDRIRERKEKD